MKTTSESRRAFSVRLAAIPAALGTARAPGAAGSLEATPEPDGDGISHAAAAIHQEISFTAAPSRIYQILTRGDQFDRVVRLSAAAQVATKPGSPPTRLEAVAGSSFTLFGGYVTGRQIDLIATERIIQVWRAASWEAGAYSLASFVLKQEGPNTRLIFDHRAFPGDQAAHLARGWHLNYWDPIGKLLSSG
jgi:activator of HSP90 ATPase